MRVTDEPLACVPVITPASQPYTAREELLHAVSHGVGFVAAAVGLVFLTYAASIRGTASHTIGSAVFGSTLLLLYGVSTLYHALPVSTTKRVLQKLDHIAIYLLIAGTYTPFLLIKLHGPSGWRLLALIWMLAIAGILLELIRKSETRRTSIALYLGMGGLVVFAIEPLIDTLEPLGLALLGLGGLSYLVGVVFYAWNRLPYNHAVWHGFVLGGSAFHFASIFGFVLH